MWGAIISGAVGLFKGLFGGGSGGANQQVVTTLAQKILPQTEQEKAANVIASEEEDIKDVTAARVYQAPDMPITQYQPGMGIIPFFLMWTLDVVDHAVDSVNHIIRPATFIWLAGGLSKAWALPDPNTVDARVWQVFMIVVTFFFGGRTLVKDIIPSVQKVIEAVKK